MLIALVAHRQMFATLAQMVINYLVRGYACLTVESITALFVKLLLAAGVAIRISH